MSQALISTPMPKPLRVLSWNILEGFHHKPVKGQVPLRDEVRLAAAHEVLNACRPDVVVFNEALWVRKAHDYVMEYASEFRFPYALGRLYAGHWGNLILSRYPLRNPSVFKFRGRGGLGALIHAPGWRLRVGTYHPHPDRRPADKAKDFGALLNTFDANVPGLVTGDFNAVHPEDGPDLERLAAAFTRFSSRPREDAHRFIASGAAVFREFEQRGFCDAFPLADRTYTIPTDMLSEDKGSAMRIDHMWVNTGVVVERAEVIRTAAANVASDHYPILCQVRPSGP